MGANRESAEGDFDGGGGVVLGQKTSAQPE
jgi:hypothetical protein